MIPQATASFGLSLATGILKLAGRLDNLQAEKVAVRGELVLTMPGMNDISNRKLREALGQKLEQTATESPDPIGADDRAEIQALLSDPDTLAGMFMPFYTKLFPDQVVRQINPDAAFLKRLDELGIDDEEARLAAFYIAPGNDDRKVGYAWRIGLTVADAVFELGAENTSIFIRDPELQKIAGAVLTRFAESDLEQISSWKGLLHHAIQATLNGALDARESLGVGNDWAEAILDALVNARESADNPSNYIMGLVRGKGYQQLIRASLETAAVRLDRENAGDFERLASEFLKQAAPLVEGNTNFKDFFENHWGDLLRAGFSALEIHGPVLLKDESPLLQESLLAIVGQLAETPDASLFNRETVLGLVDSVVAAVVSHPDELGIDKPWLNELVQSVAGVIAERGVGDTFNREGAQALVRSALTTLAEYPELIAKRPGLVQEIVGGVLRKLGSVQTFGANELATAAVEGALEAVAHDPNLLNDQLGSAVAELAGLVAEQVRTNGLSKIKGTDLLRTAITIMARRPELIVADDGLLQNTVREIFERIATVENFNGQELASAAVEGALEAVSADPDLLNDQLGSTIAGFAGFIAERVRDKGLTNIQGVDLLNAFTRTLLTNPQVFLQLQSQLGQIVVVAVLDLADGDEQRLLIGSQIVVLAQQLLTRFSVSGRTRIDDQNLAELAENLQAALTGGMALAGKELGTRINRDSLPVVLAGMVDAWLNGDIETIDLNDLDSQQLIDKVIKSMAA